MQGDIFTPVPTGEMTMLFWILVITAIAAIGFFFTSYRVKVEKNGRLRKQMKLLNGMLLLLLLAGAAASVSLTLPAF